MGGNEVLMAVIMDSQVLWVATACSSEKTKVSEEHITSIFRV
jgi:hypothetical protein